MSRHTYWAIPATVSWVTSPNLFLRWLQKCLNRQSIGLVAPRVAWSLGWMDTSEAHQVLQFTVLSKSSNPLFSITTAVNGDFPSFRGRQNLGAASLYRSSPCIPGLGVMTWTVGNFCTWKWSIKPPAWLPPPPRSFQETCRWLKFFLFPAQVVLLQNIRDTPNNVTFSRN